MKKYLIFLMMAATIAMFGACSPEDENEPEKPGIETPETPGDGEDDTPENPDEPENPDDPGENPDTPEGNSKILVAYFSWGGTTQRMAQSDRSRPFPHRADCALSNGLYRMYRGGTRGKKQ